MDISKEEHPVPLEPKANEVGESEDGSHKLLDLGLGKGKRMVIRPTPALKLPDDPYL